ncbi:MAG: hypothetical protein P8Y91_08685 [Desulfuromonadales bacterium]
MIHALKRWLKPTRSRLSRRIVFYVFVSVVVIETIILIPSTMKREKELFQHMRSVAWGQIEMLMTLLPPTANASLVFDMPDRYEKPGRPPHRHGLAATAAEEGHRSRPAAGCHRGEA